MKEIKKESHKKIIIAIIIIAVMIDQIGKIITHINGWDIIANDIDVSNNGYHIIMSIIIIVMIIRYISTENTYIKLDTKIILSFAISGAIGNLIDRIWNKNVINYIHLGNHIDINLSYIYITIAWIGMAAILTKNTMKIIKERNSKKEQSKKFNEKINIRNLEKNEYNKNKSK